MRIMCEVVLRTVVVVIVASGVALSALILTDASAQRCECVRCDQGLVP